MLSSRAAYLVSISLCLGFCLAAAPSVKAETVTILKMADGRFYHPASGRVASTEQELLSGAGMLPQTPAPSTPQQNVSASTPIPDKPVILKMADGRFYHPASGRIANSEASLLAQIGWNDGSIGPVTGNQQFGPLLSAVYRAQAGLRAQIAAQGKDKRYAMSVVGQDAPRNVTIAVWNKQTDQIEYVDGLKQGRDLDIEGGSPVKISIRLTNWINTDYATNDANHVVVAVRYPIWHEIKQGTSIVRYDVEEAVYTPYNSSMHQAEIVKEGERILDETIEKAAQELKSRGIGSRALSGKNVTDTVAHDLIKALVVIEHTNSSELRSNPGQAAGKVFATIGLNPGQAYNYSGSSAGALGLAQFIPSTYNRLATRAELGLVKDFQAGMRDHQNAIKASYAYLDAVLGELPAAAKDLPANSPRLFEYLAAAYNGGSSKVKTAIQIWDEQISGELKPVNILARSRLQPETIDYVKKIRAALPVILGQQPLKPVGSS
ncbi:transglycosylase SLT domain-containing protein [Candidatus Uhrbacteria bacterium]|nr:transglycosylase SLT domain-containing protein [Candidatus Uhrbacteria bacterium]